MHNIMISFEVMLYKTTWSIMGLVGWYWQSGTTGCCLIYMNIHNYIRMDSNFQVMPKVVKKHRENKNILESHGQIRKS